MKKFLFLLLITTTSVANSQVHEGVYYGLRDARENIDKCTALLQSGRKLTKTAASICRLVSLEHLDLMTNKLDSIPTCFGSMPNLKNLYLSANAFRNFPESICASTTLEVLTINGNQLSEIPESIGGLISLEYLYLSSNKLSSLPEGIGSLKQLKFLEIQNNKITVLPLSMRKLSNLEQLICDGSKITNLMEILPYLKNLKVLSMGATNFESAEAWEKLKSTVPKGCLVNPTGEEIEEAGYTTGYYYPKLWD